MTQQPPLEEAEDHVLVRRHVEGDPDAFNELFLRHRDRLWSLGVGVSGDHEVAAEGVQEGLVTAFRRSDSWTGETAVGTWLLRLVVQACTRVARRTGSDETEHNAEAPLVYDGDSDTMWQTEGYEASSFVLKSGAGVTVDLGQNQDVSSVTLDLPESLDGTVYVADGPTNDEGELGSFSNESGEVTIDTDDAVQGRYVTVWFTSLAPDDDGRYRASLAEITVR